MDAPSGGQVEHPALARRVTSGVVEKTEIVNRDNRARMSQGNDMGRHE